MTTIFILCAGSGHRWRDHLGVPKQLITFGGVTLLERISRAVRALTDAPVLCVTRDERISLPAHKTLLLPPNDALAETICATAPYWSDRNIFLLGDVFYSDYALQTILAARNDLMFFGRPWPSAYVACGQGEMFGASFTEGASERMFALATEAIAARRAGERGNLWNVYQLAAGLTLGSSRRVRALLHAIDDYTNDIDTPVDYDRRKILYERIASAGVTPSHVARQLLQLPKHLRGRMRWWLSCTCTDCIRPHVPS